MSSSAAYRSVCNASVETKVLGMLSATWMARCIYYGVRNDLFRRIDSGVVTAEALSRELDTDADIVYRLLKGLEHLELIAESSGKAFRLTPLGRTLLPGARGRLADMAILWGEEFHRAWTALPDAVRTNRTGFEAAHTVPLFSYLNNRPHVAARFGVAMHGIAELLYPEVAVALDWSTVSHVMDVGGGNGYLISTLLNAHPHLHGTLFDLPHVVEQARGIPSNADLGARLNYRRGNFFEYVPQGADCIVMSNIIHDWDDEHAVAILSACRNALPEDGSLVLLEMALDDVHEPLLARSTDLNMLALTGGKERSMQQFRQLFAVSGFNLDSVTTIQDMTCAIVARPAGARRPV